MDIIFSFQLSSPTFDNNPLTDEPLKYTVVSNEIIALIGFLYGFFVNIYC